MLQPTRLNNNIAQVYFPCETAFTEAGGNTVLPQTSLGNHLPGSVKCLVQSSFLPLVILDIRDTYTSTYGANSYPGPVLVLRLPLPIGHEGFKPMLRE